MTPDPLNDDIKRSEIRYRGLFENMISAAMVLSHRPAGFRIEAINAQCRQFAVLDIAGRSVAWLHEVIDTLLKWSRPAHPRPFRSSDPERFEEVASDRLHLIECELDWSRVDLPGIKVCKGLNRLGGNGLLYLDQRPGLGWDRNL